MFWRKLDGPEGRGWGIEFERQEKAIAILRAADPHNLRRLSDGRSRVNDRELLADSQWQTQLEQASVGIHDQREGFNA